MRFADAYSLAYLVLLRPARPSYGACASQSRLISCLRDDSGPRTVLSPLPAGPRPAARAAPRPATRPAPSPAMPDPHPHSPAHELQAKPGGERWPQLTSLGPTSTGPRHTNCYRRGSDATTPPPAPTSGTFARWRGKSGEEGVRLLSLAATAYGDDVCRRFAKLPAITSGRRCSPWWETPLRFRRTAPRPMLGSPHATRAARATPRVFR